MKITVLQENLKNALTSLQKAIPNKPQLPILSSVYLKAEKNQLILAATDLYLGVKCAIPAEIKEEATLVVPGEILKNLIFSFSAGEIEIEQKDSSLILKYANSTSTLPYQLADEYPQFPEIIGENYILSAEVLRQIEQYVSFAGAVDQTRPVLASLLFSFKKSGLEVVGTDGFRLAVLTTADGVKELEQDILIPVKSLTEVFRMVSQTEVENVEFTIAEELKQVLFTIGDSQVYIRLTEGEFPPYQKIIPPDFAHEFSFSSEELHSQIKRAFLFSRDSSNIVRLKIEDGIAQVLASSPAHGEYQGEIAVSYKGEPLEIAFNALYLLDFLSTQKEDEVRFLMNESLKPAAFKTPSLKDYLYVVMPFRTTG